MADRTPYPPEIRAQVVADLATGMTVYAAAKKWGIAASTITTWGAEAGVREIRRVDEEQEERLGRLVWRYLEQSLETLTAQMEHFRDPDWLQMQDAGSLAILHGTVADKTVRLLASLRTDHGGIDGPPALEQDDDEV